MSTVTIARNEIEPLLTVLIDQLAAEGRATESAVYSRIQHGLREARHDHDLAQPLNQLSSTLHVCPSLSEDATVLLSRILEKAQHVTVLMEMPPKCH